MAFAVSRNKARRPPSSFRVIVVPTLFLPLVFVLPRSSRSFVQRAAPVARRRHHRVTTGSSFLRTTHPPPPSWLLTPASPSHLHSTGGGRGDQDEGDEGGGGSSVVAASRASHDNNVGAPNRDRDGATTATVNSTSGVAEIGAVDEEDESSVYGVVEGESLDDDITTTMPWSEFQDWALRDNLPRFTVTIPPTTGGRVRRRSPRRYALWRAMIRDVPELHGYDVPFVRLMHARLLSRSKKDRERNDAEAEVPPDVLPLLDDFVFEGDGGASGVAYGVGGVADGCHVRTTPLLDVGVTVPLGYVYTTTGGGDGGRGGYVIAYELGTPATAVEGGMGDAAVGGYYSMARYGYSGAVLPNLDGMVRGAVKTAKARGRTTKLPIPAIVGDDEDVQLLVNIGGATAALFAAGAAANLLSHHLTVNVFWV